MFTWGRLLLNRCQFSPPSSEAYRENSVPAKRRFGFLRSSRTTCTTCPSGMFPVMFSQVAP